MPQIRLLSEEVIGKIAAGEVVERPSAAIKELVENSLDAGANAVTVEIRDGGISYFRVTDNGCGIRSGDIRMAFERHATSKIRTSDDLTSIATLGFRGEALASVAAVSHVTLTTRTHEDASGIRVTNNGGTIEKIEEASCPEGTTIIVRDLFYNTPVRLKFLKKPATETSFVTETVMHLILSRPDVAFLFFSNGKKIYQSVGDGKLSSALHSIYGTQALKSMRYVEGCASGIKVDGYVGIGENARGNRSQQSFFINGRMMRSTILSAALENACRERVMIGRYPICALHLTMPYDSVDVNVHPNKLEVRFRDETAVSSALTYLVSQALTEQNAFEKPVEMRLTPTENDRLLPPVKNVTTESIPNHVNSSATPVLKESAPNKDIRKEAPVKVTVSDKLPQIPFAKSEVKPNPVNTPVTVKPEVIQPIRASKDDIKPASVQKTIPDKLEAVTAEPLKKEPSVCEKEEKKIAEGTAPVRYIPEKAEQLTSLPVEEKAPLKILGALFNTFILVEYRDHLLMVDQHAVHERILFDRMMKLYGKTEAVQELLVPVVISATKQEQALILENDELLRSMGLTIEPFGDHEVAIRTVPMILGQTQATGFVREALAELETGRSVTFEKKRAAILQMACKHAVKGGDALAEDDLRYLVESMIDRHVTPTCPHGRPLVVSISHSELDRKFKRIQ